MPNPTLLPFQSPQEKIKMKEQRTMRMNISTQTAPHPNSSLGLTQVNNFKEHNMKTSFTQVFRTLTFLDQRAILHSIWNALTSQKTLSLLRIRGRQELVKPNPLS